MLCYLEGKTQDEAAAELGVSKATLKKRLERGRALLRVGLVRRGLGPVTVLLAGLTGPATALFKSQFLASVLRADRRLIS